MEDKTRGEVISMPVQIAIWFQRVTGIVDTWAACKALRHDLFTAERETTAYAEAKLYQLVQHISTHIRLSPGILDYALSHADVDDKGNVIVILIENNYTADQLNADVDYLHYNITMTGAPYYIIHEGRKIAVDRHEMYYRSIDPQSAVSFDPNDTSPLSTLTMKTTRIKIERFGTMIETLNLNGKADDLIRRFGYEMDKAIKEGRTHKVIE